MENLLRCLASRYTEILKGNLVGFYLHGSYAMSGFDPSKSDLDFLLVCETEPNAAAKKCILDATFAYMLVGPAKGLEMHVVLSEDVLNPTYPPRFVLHASPAHTRNYLLDPGGYVSRMKGTDDDLTAHFAVVYERGLAVMGPDVKALFHPVPRKAYLESIAGDFAWNAEDCEYHVLNRCRTAAYLAEGKILSKTEGAEWALSHLPSEDRPVILAALEAGKSGRPLSSPEKARAFCRKIEKQVWEILRETAD